MGDAPTHRENQGAHGHHTTVGADASVIGERAGDSVGPYRLLSLLGEGGFGVVFLAERRTPFVQRVALKIIKPGMDSRQIIARFEQERQALAVMDHPNVARVLDAGATPTGRPYFVMEHVAGEPITTFCDRHNLTIRQRLELFIPVCEAVQHAHMKGIIHRDIKPSNVLVSIKDSQGAPIPKVIDFGVAKAISHTLTDKTIFTEHGQIIGTPEYMSPEQAEMGALDIDTRTDVYSLGVMLYELLAGALPFDAVDLRSKGYAEIQRIIREVEPPRPSEIAASSMDRSIHAQRRSTTPHALARMLHKELEWVPLMAMRKDRSRRYSSPKELSEDIRSYLDGNPLRAGPESNWYKFGKLAKHHLSMIVAIGLAASLGALFSMAWLLPILEEESVAPVPQGSRGVPPIAARIAFTTMPLVCIGLTTAVLIPLRAVSLQIGMQMVTQVRLGFLRALAIVFGLEIARGIAMFMASFVPVPISTRPTANPAESAVGLAMVPLTIIAFRVLLASGWWQAAKLWLVWWFGSFVVSVVVIAYFLVAGVIGWSRFSWVWFP